MARREKVKLISEEVDVPMSGTEDGITILVDDDTECIDDLDKVKKELKEVQITGTAEKGVISAVLEKDESADKLEEASQKVDKCFSKIIANTYLNTGILVNTEFNNSNDVVFRLPEAYTCWNDFKVGYSNYYHKAPLKGSDANIISWLLKDMRKLSNDMLHNLNLPNINYTLRHMKYSNNHDLKDLTILLYSGGKDSTCRLLELLDQGKTVLPIMIQFNAHDQRELFKTEVIKQQFCKLVKAIKPTNLYAPLNLYYTTHHTTDDWEGLSQQQTFAIALSLIGGDILKRTKSIEYCLVAGDQGIGWIHEIKKLYKTVMKFNGYTFEDNNEIPKLSFPYLKHTKRHIYRMIDKFVSKYNLGQVYFPSCQCEDFTNFRVLYTKKKTEIQGYLAFDIEPCNQCASCETINYWHAIEYKRTFVYELKYDEDFLDYDLIKDQYLDTSKATIRDQL